MKFYKIHGAGNDYLFIDNRKGIVKNPNDLAIRMCKRHFGVDADGIILVEESKVADFRMRIFNRDGSEAEMCGNGIRGFAKYVYDEGLTNKKIISIETLAGIKEVEVFTENGKVVRAVVSMGAPIFEPEKIGVITDKKATPIGINFEYEGKKYTGYVVSMGNPHCVSFIDEDIDKFPLHKFGPYIEHHKIFPNRTNVEIVKVVSEDILEQRTWERGSGETLACGTGASAVAVVSHIVNATNREVFIKLKGGEVKVKWDNKSNQVFLSGPVDGVFKGEWLLG